MSRDVLRTLGAHVAEQQDASVEQERLDAGAQEQIRRRLVERVVERAAGGQPRHARRLPWLAVAAGVLFTLAGLGLVQSLRPREEALQFTVGLERQGSLQALEAAPENAELPLSFSDGSVVDLAPGARARVAALHADGADIVLEAGRARVDVVPRRAGRPAHWQLRSGPFSVQVKGTSFWLSWDPASSSFSLDLLAGEVLVTGCNLGNGRQMRAGERIEANCRTAEGASSATLPAPTTTPMTAPPSHAAAKPELELEHPTPHRKSAARRAKRLSASNEPSSWQQIALDGDFPGAYALASSRGWDAALATATQDDLLLLAQTARVTGHVSEARRAYAAVRRRFAGTPAAARAAFGLGVLAFDTRPKEASEWLETYLAEQPAGPLSGAALDRLFEAALRLDDGATQRRIARRYVEQNASGPHLAEARRLLAESVVNE